MNSSTRASAPEKGKEKRHQSKQEQIALESSTGATNAPRTPGDSPYCIFKIPECLTHNKHNAYGYQPTVVAIGPHHHGKKKLKWIEGQKKEFKELFIRQTGAGVNDDALIEAVESELINIKRSYLDPSKAQLERKDLIEMMVLDGCFLLTLFLTNAGKFTKESQIFSIPWALPSIRRDLLLLANQIPLVVLQRLLDTAKFEWTSDLHTIALDFFKDSFKIGETPWVKRDREFEAKHLLDLICQNFILTQSPIKAPQTSVIISNQGDNNALQTSVTTSWTLSKCFPCTPHQPALVTTPAEGANNNATTPPTRLTLPVNKLRSRGVKIKLKKGGQTLLDISFKNGVLQIPEIILDDFMSVLLLNCIAFEQFYAKSTPDITSYAMFMGCLINSKRDVAYLVEKGIIQNYLGTEDDVSRFFKRILNDYVYDRETSYLTPVIRDVEKYSSKRVNVGWASFKQTYVGSLWIFLSKLAALAILLLTIAQVVLAVIALKSDKKKG